jgi:hypothetical protein
VRIARRGIEDSTRLGRVRWVVERTMSWLLSFRGLALRYDRTQSTDTAAYQAPAAICMTVPLYETVLDETEVSGRQASHSNARSASSRSKRCGSNGPPAHSSRSSCSGWDGSVSAAWNSS